MVRYFLKEEFREKIFKKAVDKEGSEAYLGRKLGYTRNAGYRFRELRRGEKSTDKRQLKVLADIAEINWMWYNDIFNRRFADVDLLLIFETFNAYLLEPNCQI
jgi:hypothetical protein